MNIDISELKVLICDDSMLIRKKMHTLLEKYGVKHIYEAGDGEISVATYKLAKPHITFMDIVMPKMTGVEALSAIKKENPDAIVIMASSVGTQANLKEAIEAGAYDFIQKPVDDEQFVKMLDTIVKGG